MPCSQFHLFRQNHKCGLPAGHSCKFAENKGIFQSIPGHHNPVGTSAFHCKRRIFHGKNSAVCNHRNGNRRLSLFNFFPIWLSVVHHTPASAVDGDHIRSRILANPGKFCGKHIVFPNSRATFHRHRFSASLTAPNDRSRSPGIQHQGASLAALEYIGNRTSHININNIKFLQKPAACHVLHHRRIPSQKLNRFDWFLPCGHQKALRGPVFIFQRIGAAHFGKTQTCPKLICQHPKRIAGIPRQRRHKHICRQKQTSHTNGFDFHSCPHLVSHPLTPLSPPTGNGPTVFCLSISLYIKPNSMTRLESTSPIYVDSTFITCYNSLEEPNQNNKKDIIYILWLIKAFIFRRISKTISTFYSPHCKNILPSFWINQGKNVLHNNISEMKAE